jgi:hypothetical protein
MKGFFTFRRVYWGLATCLLAFLIGKWYAESGKVDNLIYGLLHIPLFIVMMLKGDAE